MAEVIRTCFGVLICVGPGNMCYMGMYMTPWEGAVLGCLAD